MVVTGRLLAPAAVNRGITPGPSLSDNLPEIAVPALAGYRHYFSAWMVANAFSRREYGVRYERQSEFFTACSKSSRGFVHFQIRCCRIRL